MSSDTVALCSHWTACTEDPWIWPKVCQSPDQHLLHAEDGGGSGLEYTSYSSIKL